VSNLEIVEGPVGVARVVVDVRDPGQIVGGGRGGSGADNQRRDSEARAELHVAIRAHVVARVFVCGKVVAASRAYAGPLDPAAAAAITGRAACAAGRAAIAARTAGTRRAARAAGAPAAPAGAPAAPAGAGGTVAAGPAAAARRGARTCRANHPEGGHHGA